MRRNAHAMMINNKPIGWFCQPIHNYYQTKAPRTPVDSNARVLSMPEPPKNPPPTKQDVLTGFSTAKRIPVHFQLSQHERTPFLSRTDANGH
jgi:hypothetical protein